VVIKPGVAIPAGAVVVSKGKTATMVDEGEVIINGPGGL